MRGYAIPAGMVIQPGINGYTPEFDTRPAYDPDAARDLLAEAGYPDGFEVGLDCPKNRYLNDEAICRAVAGMLAKVGITVDLAIAPMGEHIAKLRERRTDFYMLSWGGPRSIPSTTSSTSTGATASTMRPATPTRASTS